MRWERLFKLVRSGKIWAVPLEFVILSVQFSSVIQLCSTLCDPMDCTMPVFPVHHQLPELTQTHVHWVGDVIQPTQPLSPPSPPAFNLSSIRIFSNESVLPIMWPKFWSFSFSIRPSNENLGLISLRICKMGSPCSPRDSQGSSPTPQSKSISSSVLSLLYSLTLTSIHNYWKKHSFDYTDLSAKWTLYFLICYICLISLPRSKRLLIQGCSHHPQWFCSPVK